MATNFGRLARTATNSLGQLILRDQESKRQHDLKLLQIDMDRKNRAATVGLDPTANWDEISTKTAELARERQEINTFQFDKAKADIRRAQEISLAQTEIQDFLGDIDQTGDTLFRGEIPQTLKDAGLGEQLKTLQAAGQAKTVIQQGATLDLLKSDYTADSWKEYQIKITGGVDEAEAAKALVKDPIRARAVTEGNRREIIRRNAGALQQLVQQKEKITGIPTEHQVNKHFATDTNVLIKEMQDATGNPRFGYDDLLEARGYGLKAQYYQPIDLATGLTSPNLTKVADLTQRGVAALETQIGRRPIEQGALNEMASQITAELMKTVTADSSQMSLIANKVYKDLTQDNHSQTIRSRSEVRQQAKANLQESVPGIMNVMNTLSDDKYGMTSLGQLSGLMADLVEENIFSPDVVSNMFNLGIGEGTATNETRTKYFRTQKLLKETNKRLKEELMKSGMLTDESKRILGSYGPDIFEFGALDVFEGSVENAIVSNDPKQQEAYDAYRALKADLKQNGLGKGALVLELMEYMGKAQHGLGIKSFNIKWLREKEAMNQNKELKFDL